MNTKSEFARFHPTVQFIYFSSVIFFAMFIREPVFLVISLIFSIIYSLYLGQRNSLKALLLFIVPMFVLIAVINPLFNHGGVTILFYLPDGNPFTRESLIYGFVSGGLFSVTMLWCICLRYIMTSDRIIYLFGRIAPKLSLLISMILRFIPKLSSHFREVRNARKSIGRDITDGNFRERISNGVRIVSAVIQWAMENSIDTADSLESRGYGLARRTSFSLFRFEKRDFGILLIISLCDICVLWGYFSGDLEFDYFPMISEIKWNLPLTAVYLVLCIMPLILDISEDLKWKYTESKI
ncbi:MAG: energy-coupling factor transporter transmembrane protein EcfT [Clostridia bacterium]|nr:energy-coupling factor transporter transmembrane protein EcfT [Clostridia bacterium]